MLTKAGYLFSRFLLSVKRIFSNIRFFLSDLYIYLEKKIRIFGKIFEQFKGYFVDLLMAKRGRYQLPFLNLSLLILVVSGILAAPYISAYYPDVSGQNVLSAIDSNTSGQMLGTTYEMSLVTRISDKPRDRVEEYEIQSGDTLSAIAEKFAVSEDTIKWANDLKGKNPVLKPGEVLKIPPVTGVVHKVKRGETVYSIAEKYQTESQKIVNFPFNDFIDLDNFTLAVGQTLIVPDGVMPEEKPSLPRPAAPQYLAGGSGKLLFPANGTISQQPVWYHMAIDIANSQAPDIYAAADGNVIYANCLSWGYGCHIIVDNGGGIKTLYAHLQKFYVSVKEGEREVKRGQAIGKMGSTGRSTGTHLHFEVRINNAPVNPWSYLK